ncbi:2-dehydro-3-deoxy-phosphogluconate aldolase [soil metagenome]
MLDFKTRVLPVVIIDNVAHAVPLAQALLAGGVDAIEITLRTSHGLAAMEAVARAVPGMCVGAGTLLEPADFDRVKSAGATFTVSPGYTPRLGVAAHASGLPWLPGIMTAAEAMMAREDGFKLLKLFPAVEAGGVAMLKALASPLADLKFCPTGGVSAANLKEFLALPNVALVGGSWLAPSAALKSGDWAAVTKLAREASEITAAAVAHSATM